VLTLSSSFYFTIPKIIPPTEIIFRQPYTKVQHLVEEGIAERKTAADYLKALDQAGIVKAHRIGRENLFLNIKLYKLLSK